MTDQAAYDAAQAKFHAGITEACNQYQAITGERVSTRIRDWATHSSRSSYGADGDVAGLLNAMLAIRAELAAEG